MASGSAVYANLSGCAVNYHDRCKPENLRDTCSTKICSSLSKCWLRRLPYHVIPDSDCMRICIALLIFCIYSQSTAQVHQTDTLKNSIPLSAKTEYSPIVPPDFS